MSTMNSLLKNCAALNNIGVSLMGHGDFEMSARTLKDALCMIQIMCKAKPNTPLEQVNQAVQEKVQAASARLSKVSTRPFNTEFVHLIMAESNDVQSLKRASDISRKSRSATFAAVLIRDPSEPTGHQPNLNRETGIILYNYGLACHILSVLAYHFPKGNISHSKTHSISQQALVLSHSTFSKILMKCHDAAEDVESVFLAILVLSCTGKIFRCCNDHQIATDTEDAIETLMMTVEEDYVSYLVSRTGFPAAAA